MPKVMWQVSYRVPIALSTRKVRAPKAGACPSQAQHLHKDCEKDDRDDGSEEQVTHGEVLLVQEVAQGEGDGPSQAPISDDELVLGGQLDNAELVDEPGQAQHTCQGAGRGEVRWPRKPLPLSPFSSLTSE